MEKGQRYALKKYYYEMNEIILKLSSSMIDHCMEEESNFEKKYIMFFGACTETFLNNKTACLCAMNNAYSQMGTLLRQGYEQAATLKAISEDTKLFDSLIEFRTATALKMKYDNNGPMLTLLQNSKLSNKIKIEPDIFAELGWLESAGIKKLNAENLLKAAKMADGLYFREIYNSYVHFRFSFVLWPFQDTDIPKRDLFYSNGRIFEIAMNSFIKITNFKFDELKKQSKLFQAQKKDIKIEAFRDVGWIEYLTDKKAATISYDEFFKLAEMQDLIDVRKFYNNYVHSHFLFMLLNEEGRDIELKNLIYNLAAVFDLLLCNYHNFSLQFCPHEFNYKDGFGRDIFRKIFKEITESRK